MARWRHDGAGIDHPVHLGVDAEHGGAVNLAGDVARLDGFTDQAAFAGRLDGDRADLLLGEGLLDAARDEFAIADFLVAADDLAGAGRTVARRNAHLRGARFDQRLAASGPGLRVEREGLPDRPAATGDHEAPFRVGVDMVDAHIRPVGLQLIGEDARERSADMLAHLGADDVDGDDAGAVDGEPFDRLIGDVRRGGRLAITFSLSAAGRAGGQEAERDGRPDGRDEEAPARHGW